jgi:hypothetical protein
MKQRAGHWNLRKRQRSSRSDGLAQFALTNNGKSRAKSQVHA